MKIRVFVLVLFVTQQICAQDLAKFSIKLEESRAGSPVSVSLDGIDYNMDKGMLMLVETTSGTEKPVPCQVEPGHSARLWFIPQGNAKGSPARSFVIRKGKQGSPETADSVVLNKDPMDFTLVAGKNPVLSYRYATTYPPEGVNPLFKRSGFIHPLWSPGGEVLTRIQAPDHYHHYGIWGPWTKTTIDGRAVDFWNLMAGEGTVRFAGFIAEVEGSVFSGFQALQQHIDFGAKGEDQIALNEILDVRVWNTGGKETTIDYTTNINSPLKNGILLDAYRYGGGIGFRATEKWHKDNCTVLTSDGKTRLDADGSFARWCIVEGESSVPEGRSGILFLSHPSNRMHPEPMRVWPLDANGGRGDMYFEFVPIRHEAWKLEPGTAYSLKYRMIVFDGKMDAAMAEKHWKNFATIPEADLQIIQ